MRREQRKVDPKAPRSMGTSTCESSVSRSTERRKRMKESQTMLIIMHCTMCWLVDIIGFV